MPYAEISFYEPRIKIDIMKKTVIVTGANGYLGPYILAQLIEDGYRVVALKYEHFRSRIVDHPDIDYVYFDLRNFSRYRDDLKKAIRGKDVAGIIHAAAILGAVDYETNHRVNAEGTARLIEFARDEGIRRFVHVSTVCVVKKIKGPYGVTKKEADDLVRKSGLDYTIFIPAMILGPQSLGLNRVLRNMYRFPLTVPLVGNGEKAQSPIFVKDFAVVLSRALTNKKAHKRVYQVSCGKAFPFRDFVRAILRHHGRRKFFLPVPACIVSAAAKIMERLLETPPFTSEHVKGMNQDSVLDNTKLVRDFDVEITDFKAALGRSLDIIGDDYREHLQPSPERKITLSELKI